MGQVLAFTKAITDQKMQDAAMNASLFRVAYCAEGKEFKKIINDLTPGRERNMPNVSNIPEEWITKE